MELRNGVRTARKRCALTIVELAKRADVGYATLCDMERGTHVPGIDTALRVSEALGMKVEDLFWVEDPSNKRREERRVEEKKGLIADIMHLLRELDVRQLQRVLQFTFGIWAGD